jgi:hypothetical protein
LPQVQHADNELDEALAAGRVYQPCGK